MARRKMADSPIVENLASLRTDVGVTLHAYTMDCDAETNDLEPIMNMLCSCAEQNGLPYLPVILSTKLSSGGEIVREVLCQNPEATEKVQRVIDGTERYFHAVFMLATGCSEDQRLMELH